MISMTVVYGIEDSSSVQVVGGSWEVQEDEGSSYVPHVLNRPGQVQYHRKQSIVTSPNLHRKGMASTRHFISAMISFAWICTACVFKS